MVKPIPDGYPQVSPYLAVDNARGAIEFYGHVFGATDAARLGIGFAAAVPFADGMREFATAPLRRRSRGQHVDEVFTERCLCFPEFDS